MQYLNFDVEIRVGNGAAYAVTVRTPGMGETTVTSPFPFDAATLKRHMASLAYTQASARGRAWRLLPDQEVTPFDPTAFGQSLFGFLFPGQAGELYYRVKERASEQGQGTRVRLHIEPPYLAEAPWEFLYDPRSGFVALDSSTSLVHYLDLPQVVKALEVEPPLRILAMAALPKDQEPLEASAERQWMERGLATLQSRGDVDLVWLEGGTWRELQERLRPSHGPWHVFHFAGHGAYDPNTGEGQLILVDDNGEASPIQAGQLSNLLGYQRHALRLVVLNACEGAASGPEPFSGTAAALIRSGIPAVVAMQDRIPDDQAIEFARTFYTALADGLTVDSAVTDARNALNLRDRRLPTWGTPTLFMRGDGQLFSPRQERAAISPVLLAGAVLGAGLGLGLLRSLTAALLFKTAGLFLVLGFLIGAVLAAATVAGIYLADVLLVITPGEQKRAAGSAAQAPSQSVRHYLAVALSAGGFALALLVLALLFGASTRVPLMVVLGYMAGWGLALLTVNLLHGDGRVILPGWLLRVAASSGLFTLTQVILVLLGLDRDSLYVVWAGAYRADLPQYSYAWWQSFMVRFPAWYVALGLLDAALVGLVLSLGITAGIWIARRRSSAQRSSSVRAGDA